METYPTIKYVEALSDYRLFIIFDNGAIKIYSFKDKVNKPPFQALKDETLFQAARVASGGYGVIWNDQLDMSEYELWQNGKEVSTINKLAYQATS